MFLSLPVFFYVFEFRWLRVDLGPNSPFRPACQLLKESFGMNHLDPNFGSYDHYLYTRKDEEDFGATDLYEVKSYFHPGISLNCKLNKPVFYFFLNLL